jgi:hypothetical protein
MNVLADIPACDQTVHHEFRLCATAIANMDFERDSDATFEFSRPAAALGYCTAGRSSGHGHWQLCGTVWGVA